MLSELKSNRGDYSAVVSRCSDECSGTTQSKRGLITVGWKRLAANAASPGGDDPVSKITALVEAGHRVRR